MKKLFTIGIISLFASCLFNACTKEELVTVNDPLELDENSVQYQQYMEERAIQLIKKYRFDQLDNTIDRIKDPVVKERVLALLTEYRDRAFNEALYYAKPNGDTIFFFPPNVDDRKEVKRLLIGNPYQKAAVNEIGVLHGFKNFPKVETLDIGNSLATGIKDLDGLPELKNFNWTFEPYYFKEFYPEVELAPVPLTLDFSQNSKLEGVNIQYVDLKNLKFPATEIKSVSLTDAVINKSEEINGITAGELHLRGTSEAKELVLTSKATDSLTMDVAGIQSLDVSETEIKTFTLSTGVEKIKFNEGLRKLNLKATNLKEQPAFPESIEELTVRDYPFAANYPRLLKKLAYSYYNSHVTETNLSHLTQLDELSIDYNTNNDYTGGTNPIVVYGSSLTFPEGLKHLSIGTSGPYIIDMEGAKLSLSLQTIYISASTKDGMLDFSYLPNLKEITLYARTLNGGLKLPKSVEKIDFSSQTLNITELDLSQLTNLTYLNTGHLGKDTPVTLTLPLNLSESVFSYAAGWYNKPISIKTGSTIVNKPDWFDKYVSYFE